MIVSALIAAAWIAGVAYAAHAVAARLFPAEARSLRHVSAGLLGAWTATVGFQILATAGQFTVLGGSAGVAALAAAAGLMTRVHPRAVLAQWGDDLRALLDAVFGTTGIGRVLLGGLFAFPALLLTVRALLIPPLGWDTQTYHGVKAAMWVQTGGGLPLLTPGGWAAYKHYPPGAEILGAWAMLPFSSDLFYPLVDVACALGTWAALRAIARELEVPRELRELLVLYLMTVPAYFYWVGAAYAEPALYFYAFGGSLFLLRAFRGPSRGADLALGLMALFAAVQVKITALPWPPLAMAGAAFLGWRRSFGAPWFRGGAMGVVLGLAVVLPLFLRNWIELGLPLSPFAASLGPISLGEALPLTTWYQQLPIGDAPPLQRELTSALAVLGIYASPSHPSLGPLSAWLCVLAPFGAWQLRRRAPEALALGTAMIFVALAAHFSDGFRVVRVNWAWVIGRFVFGAFVWAALFAALSPLAVARPRVTRGVLIGFSFASVAVYLAEFPGPPEWIVLVPGVGLAATSIAVLLVLHRSGRLLAPVPLLLALFVIGAPPLQQLRDENRYPVVLTSRHAHKNSVYAVSFASRIDDPDTPRHIAITHGPVQSADREVLYFLMGRRFQNRLDYVWASRDGTPYLFSDLEGHPAEQLDIDAWTARLVERGVTHIVALQPPWHELAWMDARPDVFEPVVVNPGRCGLYELRAPRGAPSPPGPAAPR